MTTEMTEALPRIPDDFMQRPYEILEPYRKAGRVHHVVFPHGADVWLVTRYADVRTLLQDPRVSKDGTRMNEMFARHTGTYVEDEKPDVGFDDELSQHMLNSDPPRHTRLRALVSKAFTLRRMEAFRERIEELVDDYLTKLEGRDDVDLVGEFAQPLPIVIICDVLGIPFEDRERFQQWAVELVGAGHPAEGVENASKNVIEYGRHIIEMKRKNPAEDMVSAMIEGSPEGDRLGFVILVNDGAELMLQSIASVLKDEPKFAPTGTGSKSSVLFIEALPQVFSPSVISTTALLVATGRKEFRPK